MVSLQDQLVLYDVEHDAAGHLLRFGAGLNEDAHWLYTYDAAGNRTSEQQSEVSDIQFTYDSPNQITGADTGGPTQRTFIHDDNGNCTADTPIAGVATSYEWDAEDRLTAIQRGTLRSEFTYDGFNRRVRAVETDGLTLLSDSRYLWCGSRICAEIPADMAPTPSRFLYPEGELHLLSGMRRFYLTDHLGSVRSMIDEGGNLLAGYGYDPWGRQSYHVGPEDTMFGYAGYFRHEPTGLNLTLYRAYDPTLGRWLSRDPIGEFANGTGGATDANLYAYLGNSPLGWVDPFGLAGQCAANAYADYLLAVERIHRVHVGGLIASSVMAGGLAALGGAEVGAALGLGVFSIPGSVVGGVIGGVAGVTGAVVVGDVVARNAELDAEINYRLRLDQCKSDTYACK